jgi:GNAT superfamily N-acetyltransferase
MPILRLSRVLTERPDPAKAAPQATGHFRCRNYEGPQDIAAWLQVRREALAHLHQTGREWTAADFHREFLQQPWWEPQRMWFALPATGEEQPQPSASVPMGTVCLAVRQSGGVPRAVLGWLLVRPAWQRRGVGRLLLSLAEQAAWDAGARQVHLETHAAWHAAVAFYRRAGYAPADAPPGR